MHSESFDMNRQQNYNLGGQVCVLDGWEGTLVYNDFLSHVQYDLKLLDNSGEIPKTEWSGWRFDSQFWNLLSTFDWKTKTS